MTPESKLLVGHDGALIDPVGGFEQEYAAVVRMYADGGKSWTVSPGGLLHLGYQGANLVTNTFDEDGSRRYLDAGEHPEYSTAEDNIFLMAAYRTLWGHQATADDLTRGAALYLADPDRGISSINLQLYSNITDYKGNVWGRHNNVLSPRALSPQDYIPAFLAHRASRIVWSGSGYVRSPDGNPNNVQRCLSERAEFIEQDIGWEDTDNRALYHTRDEPLSNGDLYRRNHDTAAESVFAPNVNALMLASEVMIARACALGTSFDDLRPVNGPEAIKDISRDITLQATVEVGRRGMRYSGVQMQHEIAERTLGALAAAKLMTAQDKRYETVWQDFINKLEHGQLTTGAHDEQYLFDWVPKLETIDDALASQNRRYEKYTPLQIAQVYARHYHQILPKFGTGMQLILDGAFPDSPSEAIIRNGPPLPDTRAGLRGDALRRLNQRKLAYVVDWLHLKIEKLDRTIILKDPFAREDSRIEAALQKVGA